MYIQSVSQASPPPLESKNRPSGTLHAPGHSISRTVGIEVTLPFQREAILDPMSLLFAKWTKASFDHLD